MNCAYLAHLTINPGHDRNTVLDALRDLERLTQAEPECLLFRIFETPDENELVIWEVFTSDEALQTHYETPYTAAYFETGYTRVKSFYGMNPLQALEENFQSHFLNA